jgi:hypothetical protein
MEDLLRLVQLCALLAGSADHPSGEEGEC